jgi:DNA-directed RNA polymerase specialized sigma24 family protein
VPVAFKETKPGGMAVGARRPAKKPDSEDGRRFEELALPQLKALYRLAFRLTANAATAEDLVQETYLKALQAFGSLRNPAAVRP